MTKWSGWLRHCTKFQSIATDQAHEQIHELVKDEGSAISILHSPKALIQWMLAGSEISRI